MAQDFMNTQTGGEGETIQLQTDIKSTPEQFDVKLPQQAQDGIIEPSNPNPQVATVPNENEVVEQPPIPFAPEPTQEQVTEEVKVEAPAPIEPEKKPTEPQKQETKIPFAQAKVDAEILPSSVSMFSDPIGIKSQFDANNPYVKNTSLLTPTIDVINVGEIVGQPVTQEDDSDIIFQSEAEKEQYEEDKQFESLDPSVQAYVQAVSQTPVEEDPTIKKMNEVISKGKAQGGYDGILERVTKSVEDDSTFGDVNIPSVKFDKTRVSSNYNNWAELMGVTEDQISEMAEGAIVNKGFEEKANTISNILTSIDQNRERINSLEESLTTGKLTPEAYSYLSSLGPTWIQPGGKIDKQTKYQISQSINNLKKQERVKRKELVDVNNQVVKKEDKYIPPKAPVTKIQEFENRVNTDLKSIYSKKWEFVGKDQGIPFYKAPVNLGLSSDGFNKDNISTPTKIKEIKDQAKWLDKEGRELIARSVASGNPKIFFNNENAKNLNPGLTEYARDLFEVEYNKDFKKNGSVDPYTYDGFKRTAEKLAKENSTKLNSSIADNANDVVANVTQLNNEWVNKNQKILTTKINQVKTSMDEVLSGQIMSEIQRNPNAAAIRDKYSALISVAPSQEEANKLNDQMMSELKQIPAIGKAFGEYKENLDGAVIKLQADYHREWYSFRQDLYDNSVNDLRNKIAETTKEIYRGGINNDLNLYQGISTVKDPDQVPLGADGVVKSKKFKEASYYEKRKMISNQWELEKAAIINYTNTYIKNNVEKYPVNKEEAAKHWSEWTGYRPISDKQKNQWLASMPERTGYDAKNRYIFYAIDDLLYPNNSKPTVFGIKSFADAELDKIKYLEEKFGFKVGDHIGDFGDTRDKLPISQKEEEQLLSTKRMLQDILAHSETDQEWYNELMNGFASGFDVPILGAFVGIQRNQNLQSAMKRYQDGTFDSFDISMTEAQAALNKLNEIRPPSTAYQIGSGLGFTTTFMLEMAMTGGVNQIGRSLTTKAIQTVTNIAKSSADDVVRVAAERAAPETIQRIEKIAAFLGGGMLEGAASPRAYEFFTQNMLQNITIQELGTYDGLIAQFDNTSKNEFNEFVKAYANWMGMATIERLGAHLPIGNVSKEVLEYMGTETFLKRSIIGAWFRSAGFKSIDEASEYLATTAMPWSGILPEFSEELLQGAWESIIYGEQVFGYEKQADGTEEIKFFGMTPEEIKITAATVAIFGAGSTMVQNAKATIYGDQVTIQAEDIDGTSQIVQIDKDFWNQFNGIVADPNLSWQAVSKILEQSDLSVEQQRAMATVFIKTRGLEILADKDYQQWKEDNKEKIEENKKLREAITQNIEEEESKLTEEEKALRDYQFMTTGLQYDNEGKPMNFWESLNAKDNMWMSINMVENQLADANMPIVEVNEDGEKVESNTKDNAEAIVKKKKKADADKEKTPNGKKTTKIVKPETSQEEVSPSGVVQEEQVQVEEVAPEEVTQEGGQANLTKEEIEARRKETEAKIKNEKLFRNVGNFSLTEGGSNKAAVPFSHREKNGIEVVEYAHPDTGSIDLIITGTSNNDFVGFYRLYENGKPTNRWSSKIQNKSRNKENFKTMIGSVQELLPAGHEYTEKENISTDGLRIWNQQLDRGYELQYDENGNLVTNEVAINGEAIVNELGIAVERGRFSNINVRSQAEFEKVKQALLPYLQKFGLNESNIRWMSGPLKDSGTVKIDLPVLKKSTEKTETSIETQTTEEAKVNEETSQVESNVNPFQELSAAKSLKGTAKTNAIKEIKAKYGPDYNRISKIDTNFARIVKELEKNNLINKDC